MKAWSEMDGRERGDFCMGIDREIRAAVSMRCLDRVLTRAMERQVPQCVWNEKFHSAWWRKASQIDKSE